MSDCTKTKFANERFALEWIEKLKKTSVRKVKPVRTYMCQYCGSWHLTSKVENVVTQAEAYKIKLKELEALIAAQKEEIESLKVTHKNYTKKVNFALNVSNKQLTIGAGHKKQSEQSAFLFGANKMRELIKELIK